MITRTRRIISLFLCLIFCLALPLGASALTENQIKSYANSRTYNIYTWFDYHTVLGNMALPMVDAAILRNPNRFGAYYAHALGRLSGGCTAQMLTEVRYTISTYENGVFTGYDYSTVTRMTPTFNINLTSPKEVTLETQFVRDTGYESHQFNPGLTTMDAYFVAYMGGGFNYWSGVHLLYENMP